MAKAARILTGKTSKAMIARPTRTARIKNHFTHTRYVRAFTTKFRAH